MTLSYATYACTDCTTPVLTDDLASGPVSTPPVTIGGGSCSIALVLPFSPPLNDVCA